MSACGELRGRAELPGDVHGAGDVLEHHRGLDRVPGVASDGERAVVRISTARDRLPAQRLDDAAADGVVADQGERPDRDLAAELVGHHREHARDRLAARRPGRRVGRVGVHDAADLGHVPVDVGVRGGVGRRRATAVDEGAVEVADDHRLGGQLVVGHPGRLDHEQVVARHAGGDVARRPDDQPVAGELGVQAATRAAQLREASRRRRRSRSRAGAFRATRHRTAAGLEAVHHVVAAPAEVVVQGQVLGVELVVGRHVLRVG